MNWKGEFYELNLAQINDKGDDYNKLKVNIYSGLTLLFENCSE